MKIILAFIALVMTINAHAFSPSVFRNNKESISRKVTNIDLSRMNQWLRANSHSEEEIIQLSKDFLNKILTHFVQQKNYCDLYLPPKFLQFSKSENIIREDSEINSFYTFLRHKNLIDDLFYDLLKKTTNISIRFEDSKNRQVGKRPANLYRRYSKITDLKNFYAPFELWPDDFSSCTVQAYLGQVSKLNLSNSTSRDKDLKKLNWLALEQKIISLEVYNKLEALREANITKWPITMPRYIDIIKNAKDKKAIKVEEEASNDFHSTYVLRRENITRRGKLYAAYNSTQVYLMSQIIERTAKRMDAKYVELSFQYTDDPNGEGEVYIFSPMEQYRISLKMLKKEMAELVRSDNFRGTPFDYGDLIAASYETGLLKSEDINQILKFEDFWNPQVPRWRTYANYAFSLAGTATYYLPPPWNLLGAVGLIMTQMKVSDEPEADPDDNWNTII